MRYDKDRIIEEFALTPFGARGWLTNKDMECPFCGGSGKWGIIFNDNGVATFHCWKCPRKTTVWEFLKKVGRKDLAKMTYTVKPSEVDVCPKLDNAGYQETSKWQQVQNDEEEELKPVSLPLRLKPLSNDPYLDGRGFTPEHYAEFEPSYVTSALEPKLHNYIIFKMKVNGVCVAWWARSRNSKEWHAENLAAYKRHEAPLMLRYRNSENNFQDLLGGCDEIVPGKTNTVIIVEGIFDKVNLDNLLGLQHLDDIKCCFTFGNNIGQGQLNTMIKKQVKTVILLYDFGTINESKDTALKMREMFDTVLVTAIRKPGIDPGNIDLEYLEEVLAGATDPFTFFCNKVEIKI